MSSVISSPPPTGPDFTNQNISQGSFQTDFSKAQSAYEEAISGPKEHHAEVGILSSTGTVAKVRLGKDEEYGAHRVGSVTKTFTALLALKLVKDGVLPKGLETKCVDIIPSDIIAKVFEDPESAAIMTLEQLLSHTSGLEFDDHCHGQDQKIASFTPPSTLQERFIQEGTLEGGHKYRHVSKPGDNLGFYSNAGLAVAGWMMEAAYNQHYGEGKPFSQIMKQELFDGVFGLSESFIGPGPSGDIIQSACGDMTSSTSDLIKVAVRLQAGEADLEHIFGQGWQSTMLRPRDLFEHHGLGCSANAAAIQHAGMNRETFGAEERDVTALVIFPLRAGEPGLVALCDSSALGPAPQEQRFIRALEESAGIANKDETTPLYNLDFFCPAAPFLFHGDAYLATNVDPFAKDPADVITCSRNGMLHELKRDPSIDKPDARGYCDKNGKPWLFISKDDGRKIIYSGYCLLSNTLDVGDLALAQPDASQVQSLQGVYRDAEKPKEHPTYTFTEKNGHLYMRDGKDEHSFPCLYIPDDAGGAWVVSNPAGRSIKIRFPSNPDEDSLIITDILTGVQQLPHHSQRFEMS